MPTYGAYRPGPRADWRADFTDYRYKLRRGLYLNNVEAPAGYAHPGVDQLSARAEGREHWGDQWPAQYKVHTYMNPIGKRHAALCEEFGWPVPAYNLP